MTRSFSLSSRLAIRTFNQPEPRSPGRCNWLLIQWYIPIPRHRGPMETLSLSLSLSIYLFISLFLPSVSIYPSIYVAHFSRPFLSPSPLHLLPSLSILCFCRFLSEIVSSRYSWGSRIARGLVTRLRTHLLLARQLGPSVHQATILLISARIGSVAKCSQDYQFTMARGELRRTQRAPKTMQNVARDVI